MVGNLYWQKVIKNMIIIKQTCAAGVLAGGAGMRAG